MEEASQGHSGGHRGRSCRERGGNRCAVSRPVQSSRSVVSLCDPMDCSTPGFPVLHQLLELAQTHVHQVGDAIQPLILCRPLLLPPSIFPSIRVFSNESVLCIRWPKSWSFSFSISPSSENSGLISFRYPPRSSTKREAASYLNQEDREDLRSAVLAFARGFPRALSRHPGPLMAPGLGLTLLLCVQPL